ncbi:MAG: DUF2147 domain-containing protein [Pseudomonadales bacterium]
MIGLVRCLAVAALLTGLLLPLVSRAADSQAVFGLWAGPTSILKLYPAANESLRGKVVALKEPLFKAGEKGPQGQPVTDVNNPDPKLRALPILGMDLLAGYERNGKKWQGEIYDPESGKTYSSNLRIDRRGDLLIRGYIGAPMFGRTATFVPVTRCTAEIREMLRSAQLTGCDSAP